MLGFVQVAEGDVELTPEGHQYVEADIAQRKEIFAKAALERVTLVRQITRALESKANHTLPDEFFHDTLDEHFSEAETIQQLETAINWGRYAALFDYDSATRKFYIPEPEEAESTEPAKAAGR
jgi:NitT/TauT family transport system ATP-binding protein